MAVWCSASSVSDLNNNLHNHDFLPKCKCPKNNTLFYAFRFVANSLIFTNCVQVYKPPHRNFFFVSHELCMTK